MHPNQIRQWRKHLLGNAGSVFAKNKYSLPKLVGIADRSREPLRTSIRIMLSTLPIENGTYDLIALDAQAWSELISNTEITPGSYNKIRFEVTDAQVTTESGTYYVKIPSGVIKMGISFTVFEDGMTEITIEIYPKASLKITGNKKNPKYMLSSVIHIKSVDEEEEDD